MTLATFFPRAWPGVLVAIAVVACGSSPEPAYYALAPESGPQQRGAPRLLEVRKPVIAGYLDRDRIVQRIVGDRLEMPAGDRWGEPLDDMIGRVLAEDLSQRLPESTVFTEPAELSSAPDAVVAIELRRFEGRPDGSVALEAQVAIERSHEPAAVTHVFFLSDRPRRAGTRGLIDAMSALLGELADGIAAMLRESSEGF